MPRSSALTLLSGLSFMPKKVLNMFSHKFFSQCIASKMWRSSRCCTRNMTLFRRWIQSGDRFFFCESTFCHLRGPYHNRLCYWAITCTHTFEHTGKAKTIIVKIFTKCCGTTTLDTRSHIIVDVNCIRSDWFCRHYVHYVMCNHPPIFQLVQSKVKLRFLCGWKKSRASTPCQNSWSSFNSGRMKTSMFDADGDLLPEINMHNDMKNILVTNHGSKL